MSRIQELLDFKLLWMSRLENAENAVKYYDEEITKEINKPEEETK